MRNLHKQAARPLSDDTTYIYSLIDPRSGFVRYVGKAKNPKRRYAGHLTPGQLSKSHHRANWIKDMLNFGVKPLMEILEVCPVSEWKATEIKWIAHFRSIPGYPDLTNSTDGGEGIEGFILSEEQRIKLSERSKGRKHSPEAKARVSFAHKGRVHTEQARKNMSEGRKIWWKNLSKEEKDKISTTLRSGITEESRKKAADTGRNRPKLPYASSQYRGVMRVPRSKPWQAGCAVNGKRKHIGFFAIEEDAARARDRFILSNFPGWNIELNFPRSDYQ